MIYIILFLLIASNNIWEINIFDVNIFLLLDATYKDHIDFNGSSTPPIESLYPDTYIDKAKVEYEVKHVGAAPELIAIYTNGKKH